MNKSKMIKRYSGKLGFNNSNLNSLLAHSFLLYDQFRAILRNKNLPRSDFGKPLTRLVATASLCTGLIRKYL